MRNKLILALCLISIWSTETSAQTTSCSQNCTVEAGKSFGVAWDQLDTVNLAGFKIYLNGSILGSPLPAQGGTTTTSVTVVAGSHTIQVASFNSVGAENRSPLINFTAIQGLPGAPQNFRLLITVTNGAAVFQLVPAGEPAKK